MNTTTTKSWVGWFRLLNSDHWEPLCHADTEARCWTELLDVARAGDKMVLRRGKRPENRLRRGSLFA